VFVGFEELPRAVAVKAFGEGAVIPVKGHGGLIIVQERTGLARGFANSHISVPKSRPEIRGARETCRL
jgi:hypothetical protein